MSVTEIKDQILELSAEERSEIAAFLAIMEPPSGAELDRRMKAMDAGHKVTAEEFQKKYEELRAKGR